MSCGTYFSANCTTYNCKPGTFMKANKPKSSAASKPKIVFPIKVVTNKNTRAAIKRPNILINEANGFSLARCPPIVLPIATITP